MEGHAMIDHQRLEADHARLEAPHRQAFERFYRSWGDRRGGVFVFFTGGLLHWVSRCLSFVPAATPVALLGSGLDPDEAAAASRLGRPFHHVELPIDDNSALDFLAGAADADFGWLHVDCLVLNGGLFREMASFAPGTDLNCVWTTGACGEVEIPHSALLFVRHEVLAEVRRRGWPATPRAAHYDGTRIGRFAPAPTARALVPSEAQVELLRDRVPLDASGRPAYPVGFDYFPLFALYRLTTAALGHRLGRVRDLRRGGAAGFDQYSDEILHVNGIATYREVNRLRGADDPSLPLVRYYRQLLQVDYLTLRASGEPTPRYRRLREELEAELAAAGIDPPDVARNTFDFLIGQGLRGDTAARLVIDGRAA